MCMMYCTLLSLILMAEFFRSLTFLIILTAGLLRAFKFVVTRPAGLLRSLSPPLQFHVVPILCVGSICLCSTAATLQSAKVQKTFY